MRSEKQKDIENLMFVVKMSGNKMLLAECWDAIYGLLRVAGPASMQACITSTVVEMTEESDNPVDLVDVAEADWVNQNTMLLNVDNNITGVCPHDHNDEVVDGTMKVGLLYYRKFFQSLAEQGYVVNAYDPCVWNKVIRGKQSTICFHVVDCKISHVSAKVNKDTISWLRRDYESIFTDGSGEMKVARGKVHKYLGIKLEFTNVGVVIVTMIDYIDEVIIIKAWDEAVTKFNKRFEREVKRQRIAKAAPEDLFKVNEDAVKRDKDKSKVFHSIVAMILYIVKRARPDAALANAFLTTRVREPDEDDWRKLEHLITYLRSTCELPLVLGATQTGVLHWYVDVSFAVHQDMKGQTGGALTLGRGCPTVQTTKAKCSTHSSTIQELVAVDEMMNDILWTRLFMKEQGIKVTDNILYQDNKSAILLEKNGRASSSKRTKHIEIRYYYVADRIAKGDLSVVWCPTDKMIADYLTKPLQGKMFNRFRNVLMGAVPMSYVAWR